MSVDYRNDIQSENEYLDNLEIYVDRMDRNGVDYRTQLLDSLDTISAMESERNVLKQRLKLADLKYQELSDLWNSK